MLDIRAVIVSHFLKRRHNTLFPTQDTVPKIFPVKENEKNIVFLVTNIEAYCLKVLYILPYGRTQCYCSYFGDTCGQKCLRTVHLLLMRLSYDNIFTRPFQIFFFYRFLAKWTSRSKVGAHGAGLLLKQAITFCLYLF